MTREGGKGNDILHGGFVNEKEISWNNLTNDKDTFVFDRGDGEDTVNFARRVDKKKKDTIRFAGDISSNDLTFTRNGKDLIIKVLSKDKAKEDNIIHLKEVLYNENLEKIEFADGSVLDMSEILKKTKHIIGSDKNDVLTGTNEDYFFGKHWEEIIEGGAGDDIIDGKGGTDILRGGEGSDTYIVSSERLSYIIEETGAFENTIKFTPEIKEEDMRFVRVGEDLRINYLYENSTLIKGYFNSANGNISKFVFDDGTVLTREQVDEKVRHIDESHTFDGIIRGYDSDDILYGSPYNNHLIGGKGNDILIGDAGSHTYEFSRGDGEDTIQGEIDYAGNPSMDTIRFNEGISADDVLVERSGQNLVIKVLSKDKKTVDNTIIVKDDFEYTVQSIEEVVFADGTVWDKETLYNKSKIIMGTDGDDTIRVEHGGHRIDAGKGNDTMIGNAGSDTYVIGRGDGTDTIIDRIHYTHQQDIDTILLKEGISENDVRVVQRNGDLVIQIWSDNQRIDNEIIIKDEIWMTSPQIEQLKFANGTVWTAKELRKRSEYMFGTTGDDVIKMPQGNLAVEAGRGNDVIHGNAGSTTYVFGRGDGEDIIQGEVDYKGNPSTDTIEFKNGIDVDDIRIIRDGKDMIIEVYSKDKKTVDNLITVKNEFYYTVRMIEQIKFADGSVLNIDAINDIIRKTEEANKPNIINGTNENDRLFGTDKNDYIKASYGDDQITGGKGNDILDGYTGSDTYYFNRGDGRDRIKENDFVGNPSTDRLVFGDDMLNLIFEKQGYDMKISLANSKDQIIIENWGFGKQTEVEEFYSADNKVLHSHKIDLLIQAMAAYTQEHGMTWNQAIQERRDDVQNIYNQFWTNN